MSTTEWSVPPPVNGPQVGQLIAGRYRLALFKGGDDIAEVWHAVDESTQQVVTLEILRDRRDEARRTRFLEQAQRMAKIERPSVMKVAAIHDDTSETFVVFEHLIPLSVELPDVEPVAPFAVVPPEPVSAATLPEPVAAAALPEWVAAAALPEPVAAATLPEPVAAAAPAREWVAAATLPEAVVAAAPAPEAVATSTITLAAVDSPRPVLVEIVDESSETTVVLTPEPGTSAMQELGRTITLLKADLTTIVHDVELDTAVTAARAFVAKRVDSPRIRAGLVQLAQRARPLIASTRPMIANARPVIAKARPLIARARPLIVRARHNQIVMAVVTAALVLAVFIASPLDDAIGNALRPARAPAPSPTVAPPAALAPAPFVLPPLSAYGAAFESQGAYPTTSPNGTVEWVVALRNTGSVGWYRGIAGAQAALALPDGTGVAVQSTPFVAPGQVGWFVAHFRARAEPGTYSVPLVPRIDGRGPLPDLGIHVVVTVAKNP